ncbi:MAG: hypothetical protein NTY05_11215 [Rhodocyclales bacterium]|nr:hypothetical protein [Rhodocyclales bacterium]
MLIRAFVIIASVMVMSSCASLDATKAENSPNRVVTSSPTLVGAWEVTVSRAKGVGKNLLTFSSDGTFFRSGDTHPVVSGGHGAWKLVGPNQYNASYVSFSFDQTGKWTGINRNNLQLSLGPDGNEFTGTVKTSNRDLQDNILSTGTSPLAGKRIQVQPY